MADLDRRIDGLNADEIYVGLDRIANLVGDGHTFVEFPDDTARLPLHIKRFGEEYRVTAVAPELGNALGGSCPADSRHAHRGCTRTAPYTNAAG